MWKCLACGCENSNAAVCARCGANMGGPRARDPSLARDLLRLLAEGKKLEAVKCYKDRTGASLMDSKNAVEALQRGDTLPQLPGGASANPGEVDFAAELRTLLQQGKKLQAVKLYKDHTGVNLMDAKNAVEALERGGAPASPVALDSDLGRELLPLLRMGEKREAVRLYQRRTGAGAREAKRAVVALARQHGVYDRESGLLKTTLFVLLVGAVVVVVVGIVVFISG